MLTSYELDGFDGYFTLAEDCSEIVSFREMAEFLSPDFLELPARQEYVSHRLAALLTDAHWVQNVRHFSAEEKVPESYLFGP